MTNYVMIDGKKFVLNAEQSKDILRSVQNTGRSPSFIRAKKNKNYFYIDSRGEQRALHESLSRLLWRFSESNDGRGPYSIGKDHAGGNLHVVGSSYDYLDATFVSTEVAQRAIDEVVDPFIKANPDFKW